MGCASLPEARGLAAKAITDLGIDAEIGKSPTSPKSWVTAYVDTGLVVDEELKVAGRVPSYDDIVTVREEVRQLTGTPPAGGT